MTINYSINNLQSDNIGIRWHQRSTAKPTVVANNGAKTVNPSTINGTELTVIVRLKINVTYHDDVCYQCHPSCRYWSLHYYSNICALFTRANNYYKPTPLYIFITQHTDLIEMNNFVIIQIS